MMYIMFALQTFSVYTASAYDSSTQSIIRQCDESGLGDVSQSLLEKSEGIKDAGFFAQQGSITNMCEQMFLVGQDLYVAGVIASGSGYGKTDPSATQCYTNLQAKVEEKMSSLTKFKSRCQKLINKHPILLTGGCDDEVWCETYYIGYRSLGFEPAPWK
jgi:hypothetical protein